MEAGMKAWHDIADILHWINTDAIRLAIDELKATDRGLANKLIILLNQIRAMQRIAGVKEGTDA